jgi:outer membrane receptor protein involved in Fe transport
MKLKLTGGYSFIEHPEGNSWAYNGQSGALFNYYRSGYLMTERSTGMVSGKLTHDLSPSTRYEVGVAYQFSSGRTYDPNFGDDWRAYSDSLAWVAKGFSTKGWVDRYTGPLPWGPDRMSIYAKENSPNNQYSKGENEALDVTLDISSAVTERFGLRVGGNISSWTQRLFSVQDISGFNKAPAFYVQYNKPANEYQVRLLNGRYLVSNYGYDYLGQKTDGYTLPGAPQGAVLDPPYKPVNGGAYLQLQYETGPAAFELGARYEIFDERLKYVEPVLNPLTNQLDYSNIWADSRLMVIDESQIRDTEPFHVFLPRLGFSVVASDNTSLYAHVGQYAQFPRLDQFYESSLSFSGGLSPFTRYPTIGKFGFFVEPERTTSIEVGITQRLTPGDVLWIAGYYKQMKNQIQLLHYYDSRGVALFNAYTNADHGSAKGLEFTLEHKRWKRLAATINYTYADAAMTQWSPTSSGLWKSEVPTRYPDETYAPPFNFAHSAVINLNYRIERGEGNRLLDGMGLSVLVRLNGGHAYTRIKPSTVLGPYSIWDVGTRPLVDPWLYSPQELPGSSTTPIVYNIDLRWSKFFDLGPIDLELYVNVLNLLNTKQVINVYPMTGKPDDDGWLGSSYSRSVENNTPSYRTMYNAFGNGNRYYAINTMIGDTYGPPRQIRVGVRLEY